MTLNEAYAAPVRPGWTYVGWHSQFILDRSRPENPVKHHWFSQLGGSTVQADWDRVNDLRRAVETVLAIDFIAAAGALAEGCCPIHRGYPTEQALSEQALSEFLAPVLLERDDDLGWCRACWLSYRLTDIDQGTVLDVFLDPEQRLRHCQTEPRHDS